DRGPGSSSEIVLLDLLLDGGEGDPEDLCGPRLVAPHVVEDAGHVVALEVAERWRRAVLVDPYLHEHVFFAGRRKSPLPQHDRAGAELLTLLEDDRAFDDVAELAHVAGKGVRTERFDR